ncbi:MAG: 4-hydroxy-tetrahydrodipicolinate reductase [Kofleriaceae bacterium]
MTQRPVLVCVLGPSGRMGRAVIDAALGRTDMQIYAVVDRPEAVIAGEQLAGVTVGSDIAAGVADADVYVDFTSPAGTRAVAEIATSAHRAAVIGTTGLGAAEQTAIDKLARVAPVVVSANYSLGVNVMLGLVRQAARALGPDWDAEVVETHHRAKRDAPSGTALMIAQAIAEAHGVSYDDVKCHSRDGDVGPRPHGQIGVSSVRGGDVVGEHTATLFGPGERIEIGHRATSRSIFASGALHAAAWVVGKPPGRYTMLDVLGLA